MKRRLSPAAKLILDFAPLGAFFLGYKLGGLMMATVVLMGATVVSLSVLYVYERKVALAPLISGGLVAVLGVLTLVLKDDVFIKMKPTLLNLLFAGVLLGGVFFARRGLLKYVLDVAMTMSDQGWLILSRRWGFFFLFLAGLNEIIWRSFPTEFWVNFKVFGMFSLTIMFALSQFRLINRYAVDR